MKKKRLLFVLPALAGGGAERVACNLMNQLVDRDYTIGLFLYSNKGDYWNLLSPSIKVYVSQRNDRINKLRALINLIRVAEHYDIIIGAMELMPTYLSIIAAKLNKKKSIGWVHININALLNGKKSYISFLHRHFLVPFFYAHADRVIAVSRASKDALKPYLTTGSIGKLCAIYNPIDFNMIKEKAAIPIIEEFQHPLLIAVGRLEHQKNYPLLFDAFDLLKHKYPSAELLVLGQGSLEKILKEIAAKKVSGKDIHFKGFVKNPYAYMRQSDMLVLSSRFEGLPTVLIEALAVGTPVVAVDCPDGAAEILDNGQYGVLVENNDCQKLCEGMVSVIENKDLVDKFKERSEVAISRFSYDNIIKEFEAVFKSI